MNDIKIIKVRKSTVSEERIVEYKNYDEPDAWGPPSLRVLPLDEFVKRFGVPKFECGRLLSQIEVELLQQGDVVLVDWNHGTGPSLYIIHVENGIVRVGDLNKYATGSRHSLHNCGESPLTEVRYIYSPVKVRPTCPTASIDKYLYGS